MLHFKDVDKGILGPIPSLVCRLLSSRHCHKFAIMYGCEPLLWAQHLNLPVLGLGSSAQTLSGEGGREVSGSLGGGRGEGGGQRKGREEEWWMKEGARTSGTWLHQILSACGLTQESLILC